MSELLTAYKDETLGCTRCPLASTRTQVVFGSGDANAELMFVGEAPGYHEDQQGVPFVGQAGQLLEKLLNGIGLTRADVYIANVLKQFSTFAVAGASSQPKFGGGGGGCCGGSCGCG